MKLLREPLFHFLVLGALVFGIHSLVSKSNSDKPGEILITRGKIENLIVGFTGTWQRPPSDEELQGLIRDYVREEVAYREALAMGLDRDDSIVRGRLRQKLEFVSDSVTRVEPTDADLHAYLQAHASDFQSETTLSFEQVYLDPQRHGNQLVRDAARQLRELRQAGDNADLNAVGDPFVLQSRFENLPLSEIKKMFGDHFAAELSALKTGTWQGPVDSGYGAHLVLVSSRVDGRLPPLADVRQEVRREWANSRRREATDRFYQALLQHYTVRIEPLPEKKLAEVR